MAIHANDLPPWAQRQILQKIAAQEAQRAQESGRAEQKRGKNRKYRNTPTERGLEDGSKLRFDSQKEARRYDELMLMLKAGEIKDLRLQPQFTLQEAYTTPKGDRVRAIRYQADFSYETRAFGDDLDIWDLVVEDVKGGNATKTREYQLKRKMMLDRFGIEIHEV